MDAKRIRLLAGYSQTAAAALAHVAPLTWRMYETDPDAITQEKRLACDAAVERMLESCSADDLESAPDARLDGLLYGADPGDVEPGEERHHAG